MLTVTLSTRLNPEEVQQLDALAKISGSDRSSLLKTLVRRGLKELRMEQAMDLFQRDQITLSRAAEIAGITLWDFASQMKTRGMELHYDTAEFNEDMAAFRERQ
jgi:predicted HTH domain antitoxin